MPPPCPPRRSSGLVWAPPRSPAHHRPERFRPSMRLLRKSLRWLLISTAVVITIVITAAVGGLLWLHSSLPQTQGRMLIAGLRAPVLIERDQDGIPHIQ